jgi:predicted AlkP superfamily pyrophosphatase or phosphodiesterase
MPAIINEHPIARKDISQENRKMLQATYWNAIAVADRTVGSMIETLKNKGVYKDTLVLILGDHGESLFDDNFLGHGHALDETQTRIPLIINQQGIQIGQAVGQVDIAELLVTLATGRFEPQRWQDRSHPQFQFVGSINNPRLIGTVSSGEIRTLLDLRTQKVFFSDMKFWKPFDEAFNDQELQSRVRELIDAWERLRWKSRLIRKTKQESTREHADKRH